MQTIRKDTSTDSSRVRILVQNYVQGAETLTNTPTLSGVGERLSESSRRFRKKMEQVDVSTEDLLDNLEQVKEELAAERHRS